MPAEPDFEISLTVEQARAYFDGEDMGVDFNTALDNAQAEAREKGEPVTILLIITPESDGEESA